MMLSYMRDKRYLTEIFKYYQIKYKVEKSNNELISIYAYNEKNCILPVNEQTNIIKFVIMGKKIPGNEDFDMSYEFKALATIELPLMEVLTAIKVKYFSSEIIPATYLVLRYIDQSNDA